jgi:hypothetical protein
MQIRIRIPRIICLGSMLGLGGFSQNTIYIANLMLESACDVWRNCQIQNMMKPFHICLGHHKITLKSQEFFSLISAEAVN